LVSLLTEPLPGSGLIRASAGEWRQRMDGTWRFWLDPVWTEERPQTVPCFIPISAAATAKLVGVSHGRPFEPRSAYGY
jgi:hypothetical protein